MLEKALLIRQLAEFAGKKSSSRLLSCQPESGSGDYQEIYLEVEPLAGQKVRLFLLLGLPAGPGPFPAVLHIHGGGQTADPEHIRHWVKEGFAACSFDWTGPLKGRAKTSDLGQLAGLFSPEAIDPAKSAFLLRLLLAECALGWLASHKQVDPARLGAYGISWGGSITWLLNHYDPRLKAAAPIYGCGSHLDPARYYWNSSFMPATARDLLAWQQALDGLVLADRQNSPVLMLTGTNDFWGWLNVADLAMARLGPKKGSNFFTANLNHQLDSYAGNTLTAWMRTHLTACGSWPAAPQIEFSAAAMGHLQVLVRPDAKEKSIQEVRLNWSFSDFSQLAAPARFWHSQTLPADCCQTKVPLPDPALAVVFYVDVIYCDQTKLSSPLTRVSPLALGVKEPAADLSYYAKTPNFGWHCTDTRTEPFDPEYELAIFTGPAEQRVLTINDSLSFSLSTNKFTDPAWQMTGSQARLGLTCFSSIPGSWELVARFRPDQAGGTNWTCRHSGEGWQELALAAADFRSGQDQALPDWSFLQRLTVSFLPSDSSRQDYTAGLGNAGWL